MCMKTKTMQTKCAFINATFFPKMHGFYGIWHEYERFLGQNLLKRGGKPLVISQKK